MRLDITRILSGEVDKLDFDVSFPASDDDGFSYFGDWGIEFKDEIKAVSHIKNNGGYISMKCDVSAVYKTLCARCLKEIENSFSHSFEKGVAVELTDEENDDFIIAVGGIVDISRLCAMNFSCRFL